MNIYSKVIDKLHVSFGPLYHFLHDNVALHWNIELKIIFQQIVTSIKKDVTLTLHNTNHPFFFTVDYSLTVIGCVLLRMKNRGKVDDVSFNYRTFTNDEK